MVLVGLAEVGVVVQIVALLPKERQTLFFTATWPKAVQRIAYELLRENTVQINIGNADQELVANKDVKQIIELMVNGKDLFPLYLPLYLSHIFSSPPPPVSISTRFLS